MQDARARRRRPSDDVMDDGPETKSDPPRVISLPNAAWTTAHPTKIRDKLEKREASCRPISLSPLGHHRPTTSSPARHLPRGVTPPCSSWCRTIIDACLSSPTCPLGTSLSAGRRAHRATGPRDRGRRRVSSCEREELRDLRRERHAGRRIESGARAWTISPVECVGSALEITIPVHTQTRLWASWECSPPGFSPLIGPGSRIIQTNP